MPLYEEFGFDQRPGDGQMENLTRVKAVSAACCLLGTRKCVDKAVHLYRQWMENPNNQQYA